MQINMDLFHVWYFTNCNRINIQIFSIYFIFVDKAFVIPLISNTFMLFCVSHIDSNIYSPTSYCNNM